jgi:hypothetical protein
MAATATRPKRNQQCRFCFELITHGNLARHSKKCRISPHSSSLSDLLRQHLTDSLATQLSWPMDKLDELPDLRAQQQDTHGQCIPWQIFRDHRSECLPMLELVVVKLTVGSCGDAWRFDRPIELTKAELDDWKARLWTRENQQTKLLNIPITNKLVDREAQHQYREMVRDRVRDFYDVGPDHSIDVYSATANVTPRGTVTEVHHDSDPHISTACGQSDIGYDVPTKLWILWKASENDQLSTCYSDTVSALNNMKAIGYLIQYSGESLLLPANVPHAVVSLTSSILYGNAFHVKGRAKDPTSFTLEISAGVKPDEAIETVTKCYQDGLMDPDPRIRMIHIHHFSSTILKDRMTMRRLAKGVYINKIIDIVREHRNFEGVCGYCLYAGITGDSVQGCWVEHCLDEIRMLGTGFGRDTQTARTLKRRRDAGVD